MAEVCSVQLTWSTEVPNQGKSTGQIGDWQTIFTSLLHTMSNFLWCTMEKWGHGRVMASAFTQYTNQRTKTWRQGFSLLPSQPAIVDMPHLQGCPESLSNSTLPLEILWPCSAVFFCSLFSWAYLCRIACKLCIYTASEQQICPGSVRTLNWNHICR